MANTWIISDTHFGHSNIIEYCKRPFKDADHMDAVMIKRWQARVRPWDTVYHLGDVMLTARKTDEELRQFIDQLPGKKILILGNHDKSAERMMDFGFTHAVESAVVSVLGFSGMRVVLNHYPLTFKPLSFSRDGIPPDYVLHGHIHNSTEEMRREIHEKNELVHIPSFNINCCVEMWNYEPCTIQHIIKKHKYFEKGL